LDGDGRFTVKATRAGTHDRDRHHPRPADHEWVQRFLRRFAFGGAANAFRHCRLHGVGERQQCLMWLLSLVIWFDGGSTANAIVRPPLGASLPC
jgi:hypothetical protein